MIYTSWNVNGLRAVAKKGFNEWLSKYTPNIVALQEIKSTTEDIQPLVKIWSEQYDVYIHSALKKGYSGTALFIKKEPSLNLKRINFGIGLPQYDCEGRLIEAEFDDFFFINGYFPNGQRDHGRVNFKLDFSRKVVERVHHLHKSTGKQVIIAGDINTAHTEIDLANPRANCKTTGFLPIERAFMDEMLAGGLVDLFRHFNPGKAAQYTWWTHRSDCRARNIGWRLDYFFSTPGLVNRVIKIEHHTDTYGSDHCPILLEIN